jgi:hypothetical protein
MSQGKSKSLTIVWVRWFDASYQAHEVTLDELVTRVYLETSGMLIVDDKAVVSIALDYCEMDKTWRRVQNIPKVNIVKMRKFKLRVPC